MFTKRNFSFVGLLAATLLLAATAFAQTGSITGTVTDAKDAVVQGASITVKNTATGATRAVASGSTGAYSVTNLPAGAYEVAVAKNGFKELQVSNVVLTVDQVLTVNAKLEVGAVSERVEVSSDEAAPVELENAQLSTLVNQKTIQDLPLITRDPYSLVLLSPGTIQSNGGNGGFAVNGSRDRNNNFLLDGVDNNDTSVPGIPGGLLSLNPDSTEEFRVITNNFLPEFGRNTGAVIDIVTKSGTNAIHGDAYWFGRYNALGARDWFNHNPNPVTGVGVEKQNPYVRNDFGYSIGGPIIKDRTFFFFNSEYQRFRTTQTGSAFVPNAAFKTGMFVVHDDAGNPYNVDLTSPSSPNNPNGFSTDPTIAGILALYPTAPAGSSATDLTDLLFFPSASRQNSVTYTLKLDHRFTDKESLSVRGAYNTLQDPNPFFDDFLPGVGAVGVSQKTLGVSATLTSALTSSFINELKFGFNRANLPFTCGTLSTINSVGLKDGFGRGRDYGFDGISNWGCGTLGDSDGQSRRTGTWSLADNISKAKGTHNLKVGAEFRFVYENGFNSFSSREALTFTPSFNFGVNLADFAPGVSCDPTTGNGCFNNNGTVYQDLAAALWGFTDTQFQSQFFNKSGTRTANDNRNFRQREYGFYGQDSWKVRPNFTLSYGLRYQFNGVPYEQNGNLSNLFTDASGKAPFTFTLVGPGSGHLLYNNDFKNYEPRFGFAWDPWKNGKTSVRGGYGIFHDRIFGNLFGNARGNAPFQRDQSPQPFTQLSNVPLLANATPTATITDIDPLTGAPWHAAPVIFDRNLKIPYSQNWNFGIQHEFVKNLTLEVNYVASKGTRLLRVVDGNPPQPDQIPPLFNFLIASGFTPDQANSILQFGNLRGGFFPGVVPGNDLAPVNNVAFGAVALNKASGFSTYQSLQVNANKRFSHHVQAQLAYTWSHAIDDANDPLSPTNTARSFPRNSFNIFEERGNSEFDVRHRIVFNYTVELPFGKGQQHLNHGVMGRALQGWQWSGVSSYQTGFPFDVFGNRDAEHTTLSSRLTLVGTPTIPAGSPRNQTGPTLSAFALATFGGPGNVGRNHFYGPAFSNSNLVFSKDTSLTERASLQLRFEVYNVLNQVNFSTPLNTWQNGSQFGRSTSTVGQPDGTTGARQIQFAAKIKF
jgi:hypothetical protein